MNSNVRVVEANSDPIIPALTCKQSGLLGYALAPILIGIMTILILRLQETIQRYDHLFTPPALWYAFPILLIALICGKGPGIFALAISETLLLTLLEQHVPATQRYSLSSIFRMISLPLAGTLVIVGMEALRSNTQLLNASEAAQARMRALIGSAPVGVAILSPTGAVLFANAEFEHIWGLSDPFTQIDQLRGFLVTDEAGEPVNFAQTPYGRVISGATISKQKEVNIERPNHESLWIDARATMVKDGRGRPLGTLLIASDISERKAAEMRALRITQREAVIAKIGAAIRNAEAPESIQQSAASALCNALAVDRCCFLQYDTRVDELTVGPDYSKAGVKSISGLYNISSNCIPNPDDYKDGSPIAIDDIDLLKEGDFLRTLSSTLDVSSLIVAGIGADAATRSVLTVGDKKPRRWTTDEISLVEIVASQVRHSTISAVLRMREHKIATVLQEALRPPVPKNIPSLEIAHFYQPALDEAVIGGDFVDVFKTDPDPDSPYWAVVIGDVAGKGLTAASQVSTVRTMLRYALTRGDRVATVITHLSDTLASRKWIVGFATLFICLFNTKTLEMEYVSCGHEAGLLRRRGKYEIEELPATGSALGAFVGGTFESERVRLSLGDILFLYTDGVSDVGPDRSSLLGAAGVKSIVQTADRSASSSDIIDLMCVRIEELSGGSQYDDVCMLALQVTGEQIHEAQQDSQFVDSVEKALNAIPHIAAR